MSSHVVRVTRFLVTKDDSSYSDRPEGEMRQSKFTALDGVLRPEDKLCILND